MSHLSKFSNFSNITGSSGNIADFAEIAAQLPDHPVILLNSLNLLKCDTHAN
jgi:hypothetical protein